MSTLESNSKILNDITENNSFLFELWGNFTNLLENNPGLIDSISSSHKEILKNNLGITNNEELILNINQFLRMSNAFKVAFQY